MASFLCLASAMVMAGMLVQDHEVEPSPVREVEVFGELDAFTVPNHWQEVHAVLSQETYRLEQEGENLVLLTGMKPGWDGSIVAAEATIVLETEHPDRDALIIVLAPIGTPSVG